MRNLSDDLLVTCDNYILDPANRILYMEYDRHLVDRANAATLVH